LAFFIKVSSEENERFFKELDMLADIVAYDHVFGYWVYRGLGFIGLDIA
jgi:hypothetical protein